MTPALISAVVFWACMVGVAYIFFGYPLLVYVASRLQERRCNTSADTFDGSSAKTVSVLIAAGNEAHRLPAKIDSLLACERADQIIEIVIGSDGSEDATVEVMRSYPDERVRVVEFSERRGKSAVLAELIPSLRGEIVIMTDARQHVSPSTVSAFLERFNDPSIGVVSGELVFKSQTESITAEGVGFYWTYEKFLRKCESAFRSVPGATGALYAIRRMCLHTPPTDAILDDVAIPMLAIEQGFRCVFEPGAVAYDMPSTSTGQESIRKRRTIAGVVQLIWQHPRWILPRVLHSRGNRIWWEFLSHKVARLAAPPLLLAIAVTNVYLAINSRFYLAILLLQLAFYLAAASGAATQAIGVRLRAFAPAMMFVSLNWTTVLALIDASRGRFNPVWKRAA